MCIGFPSPSSCPPHSRSKNGVASPAYGRSKNGVASLAYVAGVNPKDVDGRDKPGHDGNELFAPPGMAY
jgi:hypothetical protein